MLCIKDKPAKIYDMMLAAVYSGIAFTDQGWKTVDTVVSTWSFCSGLVCFRKESRLVPWTISRTR